MNGGFILKICLVIVISINILILTLLIRILCLIKEVNEKYDGILDQDLSSYLGIRTILKTEYKIDIDKMKDIYLEKMYNKLYNVKGENNEESSNSNT